MIASARSEVRPFSEKEIALLENFAAQAVIAMENARLITEQREALEQQTATAEVLQVINASPGNLTPVFDAMLEKAHACVERRSERLASYDGERFHAVAQRGYAADAFGGPATSQSPAVQGRDIRSTSRHRGALLNTGRPGQTSSRPARSVRPDARDMADLGGARTVLVCAARKDGTLLGFITLYRQEVRPFSDKEIALLENFAAQAVIAMENARLMTEQREALEQQTATAEVLQVINASPGNLAPVFDAILDKAMRLCEAAFGGLFTYDGERFHTVAAAWAYPAACAELRRRIRHRPCRQHRCATLI